MSGDLREPGGDRRPPAKVKVGGAASKFHFRRFVEVNPVGRKSYREESSRAREGTSLLKGQRNNLRNEVNKNSGYEKFGGETLIQKGPAPRRSFPTTFGNLDDSQTTPKSNTQSSTIVPSPKSALSRGNSDPFRSFAIDVTPAVNNLMVLYRDYVLRAEYSLGSKSWLSSPAARDDWLNCVNSLSDPCAASGFLAMTSTILTAIRPTRVREKQALRLRTRSMALLRPRMADQPELRPYREIYLLLASEVYARNLAGARLHANMMRLLFEKDLRETGKVDIGVLTQAVYLDTQAAAMFLSQPTFDPVSWLPSIYEAVWRYAEQFFPPLETMMWTSFDPAIGSDALKHIFIMHRKGHAVWSTPSTEILSTPVVLIYCASHTMICQGRAINHYRAMADRYITAESDEFDQCCAEAYVALADLYLYRFTGTSPVVGGVRLYNAEPRILSALRSTLEDSENFLMGRAPPARYANARLWTLYVGALAEQAEANGKADPSLEWFNMNLARQARRMGVLSWQQMRPILQGFLYTDQLKPNGSEWFFKTLSNNIDL